MYFVRSGYINLPFASVWRAASNGHFWPSTALPESIHSTFAFDFDPSTIFVSDNSLHSYAFSLQPTYLYHSPMYFVRSGYINLPTGSLLSASNTNFSWSSTAYPANIDNSFYLGFNPATTNSSNNSGHAYGFPLRHLSCTYTPQSNQLTLTMPRSY